MLQRTLQLFYGIKLETTSTYKRILIPQTCWK